MKRFLAKRDREMMGDLSLCALGYLIEQNGGSIEIPKEPLFERDWPVLVTGVDDDTLRFELVQP